MNGRKFINKTMIGLWLTCVMALVHAETPLWIFSAPNPATVLVSEGGTASVQYTVTNQSRKSKRLILKPLSGLSASPCVLATRGSTCALTLTVNGSFIPAEGIHSGPVLCEQGNPNQCYQPSANKVLNVNKNNVTTPSLQTSVSNLALSVTGIIEYGVTPTTSGTPRVITITNTGSAAATGLLVTHSGLPFGTMPSTTCAGSLAAGGTCTITINPGITASSDVGGTDACSIGTAPVPGAVQVSADNAATVSTNVVVLSYGCIYQGGYVYAFDDTTPNTGSVGGKVVTTSDQANAIIWSSDSSGVYDGGIPIYGISYISTTGSPNPNSGAVPGQTACNGATDGSCDTTNIVAYYSPPTTSPAINQTFYAAGICKATISGYADWYLPAICEMGYGNTDLVACGDSAAPTLQNIQSSLIDSSIISTHNFEYWSSTEDSDNPSSTAWAQIFASAGNSSQNEYDKANPFDVRCSRALTL